jgi:hypothetical protein
VLAHFCRIRRGRLRINANKSAATADGRKYTQMILFGERGSSFTGTPETLVDILMPSFSKRYQRSSAVGFPRLLIRIHSRFAF